MDIKNIFLENASENQLRIARTVRDQYRELRSPFPYRRYMRKNKCIFIHIPKSAGSSIKLALGSEQKDRDHFDYMVYLTANPSRFMKYFKFSFVRNPWDRLVSVYAYYSNGGNGTTDKYYQSLIKNKYPTFDSFVDEFMSVETIHHHLLLKPQYLYLYNNRGKLMVDFVGKYESLNEDFEYIGKELGVNVSLKKTNVSSRSMYRRYYTDDSAKKIAILYKKDIELFGYIY